MSDNFKGKMRYFLLNSNLLNNALTTAGIDISSYTSDFYTCPTDGYIMYSGGANAGTGSIIRISGPEKNYSNGMRLFSITPTNGNGSCLVAYVRKGMTVRVEQCTGGAYIYFRRIT